MTAVVFIVVLAVLIFVHELGHFLTAKWFGVRVDAFKIGFGPRLIKWRRGETEYGINAVPFGGFVRIFGENPDEESTTGPDAGRSFVNKPRWQQAIVLVAGVMFNFIFAWVLYAIVFSVGVTASTDGFENYRDRFTNERIMVSYVMSDSPAAKAGLKEGDVVRYVETTAMNIARGLRATTSEAIAKSKPKQSITEIQNVINDFNKFPVAFEYERDGNVTVLAITPISGYVKDRYAIGISMDNVVDLKLDVFSAVKEGFRYTIILVRETFVGLFNLIAGIFRGQPNFSDVAGPVGIAGIVGNAARMGITYLLMITAIISINLGVINLIPFPALDGGRILFVLIESVVRRRISPKFTNTVNAVGFGLLILLMVIITFKDIAKFWK